MTFGDEMFVTLVQNGCGYEVLYGAVDAAVRPFVQRKLGGAEELSEELLQEIHLKVWQKLPALCAEAERYTRLQRLKWLYTVAENQLRDALRAEKRRQNLWAESAEEIIDPEEQRAGEQEETREQVEQLLHSVCAMGARPETKLAFLYNRVILPLEKDHTRKGDNKAAEAMMKGKALGQLRHEAEDAVCRALGRRLPPEVFAPLDKSIQGREHETVSLTARQIAAASYSVCAALHKKSAPQGAYSHTAGRACGSSKKIFAFSLIIRGLFRLKR